MKGLAARGLSAVIAMNKIALETFWLLNCINAEIFWTMALGPNKRRRL